MPTNPTPAPNIPTPVPQSSDPTNFDARADDTLTALPGAVAGINTLGDVTYANAVEAVDAASASAASAAAASAASGAAVWIAATNYAPYQAAISPITYQTYRRTPPGGVDAVDPSASADWVLIGLDPDEYAATAGADMTGNLSVPSLNGGALGGFRNFAINGRARINQMTGGYLASPASGAYVCDMWAYVKSGAYTTDINTGGNDSSFLLRRSDIRFLNLRNTTIVASPSASNVLAVEHRVESFDARRLIENTFTISFFVRSPKAGVHCLSLSNKDLLRSRVAEYTVNAANTTEYKSITIPGGIPDATTGDGAGWDFDFGGAVGLRTRFCLSAGSAKQVAAGAWEAGDFYATSNQVNLADALDPLGLENQFGVTGLQIESGTVATPYETLDMATDMVRCQRYYETQSCYFASYTTAGSAFGSMAPFKVTKCKAPAISFSSTTFVNASGIGAAFETVNGAAVLAVATSTGVCALSTQAVADARL